MVFGYKPTTNGRVLIAKCLALGLPLVVSRVAFGSGQVAEDAKLADIHDLIHYVADGAIGERRHEGDQLHLTVQYDNLSHPDTPMFYLSEFIVYGKDPETGEDVDLLYATLGDYRQPVTKYDPALPPSVWKYSIILVISDDVQVEVAAPGAMVTYDELNEAVKTAYSVSVRPEIKEKVEEAEAAADAAKKAAEEAKMAGSTTIEQYETDDGFRLVINDASGQHQIYLKHGKDSCLTAIEGKTSAGAVASALSSGRSVCAMLTSGRTLWLKEASISETGTLNYALFADHEGWIKLTPGETWTDAGMHIASDGWKIYTNEHTPGDYVGQIDFVLGGKSTDATTTLDRDEGLYIRPLNDSTNPNIDVAENGRFFKYTIRLSSTDGAQLIYGSNSNGDFSGVLAGKLLAGGGNKDAAYVESSLPQSLDRDKTYTCKVAKVDDGLYIKVWEKDTAEPDWQCEYHAESIGSPAGDESDAAYTWGYELSFCNKGNDSEDVTVSNGIFNKASMVNGVITPGDAFWEGAFTDEAITNELFCFSGGSWTSFRDTTEEKKVTGLHYNALTGKWTVQFANGEVSDISASGIPNGDDYMPIAGGWFNGRVHAGSNHQNPEDILLRNTKILSEEETPGTNGQICWQYK